MSYDPTVPNQSNKVRGPTGDLIKMHDNFEALAPLVSGYIVSGVVPAGKLMGFTFGANDFRVLVSGSEFLIQRFESGDWRHVVRLDQTGADLQSVLTISGQNPTQAYHLVTRAFVNALVLDDLANVVAPSPTSGQGLVFNGTNWVPGGIASTLAGLSDVALAGPVSGQALVYNGAQWTNAAVASLLSGLGDVSLASVATGDALIFSGGFWRNQAITIDTSGFTKTDGTRPFTGTISGITPTQPAHLATKAYVDTLSGLTISGAVTLSGLTDVDDAVDLGTNGFVLTLSGGNWYARAAAGDADVLRIQVFT